MAGQTVRELVTVWGFDIDKDPLKELDNGINKLKSSLTTIAASVAATAAGIGFVLNEAGKQEQTNVAFETIIGNAELARQTIQELQDFAAKTPFTIPGVEQSAKQLLGMGIELEKIIPTLKSLGDVSAGLSVPLERLALNFGQVKAQGRLTGRELRDFAIAGVPLLDELAKILNVTKEEVTSLVSAGKIGFPLVEQAFINMSSEGGKFNDLMIKQSKTLFGLISNLKDIGIIFLRDLGKDVLPVAKELVSTFVDWFQANRDIIKQNLSRTLKSSVEFLKDMISFIGTFIKSADGLVSIIGGWNNAIKITLDLLGAFAALQLLSAIGSITLALGGLASAWVTMGTSAAFAQASVAAIPIAIGAAIVAIGLIVEDILAFTQGRDSVFGRMLEGLDILFNKLSSVFDEFGAGIRATAAVILTPVRAVVNMVNNLITLFDVLRGKIGLLEGAKRIGSAIANTFGFGATDSLAGALGLADNASQAGRAIQTPNVPLPGLGGGPIETSRGASNSSSISQDVKIDLNVTGMSEDAARDMVQGEIGEIFGNITREAVREGQTLVER